MSKNPKLRLVQASANGATPPRKLGQYGLALWKRILNDYNVDDTGARELLCLACESLDRASALRDAIDKEGEFIQTRYGGLKEHPGLKPELAARAFCAKMLCRLGLHVEPLRSTPGRPGSGLGWSGE
jgi:glycine/D-amino acid oxidase-like deaminating enzyme